GPPEIWDVDADTGAIRRIAAVDDPGDVAPNAAGTELLVSNGGALRDNPPGIVVVDVNSGAVRPVLPPDGSLQMHASWSPDSQRIVYVRARRNADEHEIMVVDLASRLQRVVADPISARHSITEVRWTAPDRWVVAYSLFGPSGSGSGYRGVIEE